HVEAALHAADFGVHQRTAGIGMAVPRRQVRLLADHAFAAHFLHLAVAVGDDPVATEQLGTYSAAVKHGNGVGKGEPLGIRLGALGQVAGDDADVDEVAAIGHARLSQ